jgi:hypothetical protein
VKRIGGLFDLIYQRENLGAALWAASHGKRVTTESKHFQETAEQQLNELSYLLRSGRYEFAAYRCFAVKDTKTRTIHAPPFRDRVVHHAMIRVLSPVFMRSVHAHSYACIEGRGQHCALLQLRQWLRRSHWYGKVDVQKFYDSVNHQHLMRLLERRFRERRLLGLFKSLLGSWCSLPGRGIPIGALTSQWLGNFTLDEVDRSILGAGLVPHYMRYMDDMLLLGTKQQVLAARPVVLEALGGLDLTAKFGGEWNRASQGIPWLGFTVYPDRVRLNPNGRRRLRRKLKTLRSNYCHGQLTEFDYQCRAESLLAHAKHADDINWRRSMLAATDIAG